MRLGGGGLRNDKLGELSSLSEIFTFLAYNGTMYTEEKANFVASWVTEFLQFLAALAILQQDDLKTRVQISIFFNSSWLAIAASNSSNSVPKKQRRQLPSLLYRAGNSLICSFAHFAQIKWATARDLLRSLKTNERLPAICSGRSEEMSYVSKSLISLTKNKRMSDSLK